MFTITFSNPGEIDIRGATIAGLNAKTSDNAIGFFGTGLKYGIACILRWDGTISIYSGTTRYEFLTQELDFRGKDFQQIVMLEYTPAGNIIHHQLGFTTEYGKKWEPWQAFRELYSNALDEWGKVQEGQPAPTPGTTTIVVSCDKFLEPFHARNSIIIPPYHQPIFADSFGAIYDKPSEFFYYRGIRVADKHTALTYNQISRLDLTEDRTLSNIYDIDTCIPTLIQSCTIRPVIETALRAASIEGTAENNAHWSKYNTTSDEFIEVATEFYTQDPLAHKHLRPIIAKHRPEAAAPTPIALSPFRQSMLDRAKTLVAQMGYCPLRYPIVVASLGNSTLGKWEGGKIYLSPTVFEQGTKQVLSTLLEELVHAETGKADLTYDMQTFLFNQWVSMFEEHVLKEPI